MKFVIVGGVAGGASAASRLRRLNEDCEIIIFERGKYISYANCGLPYYIGEVIMEKSALTVRTPESFKNRFNIDVRILSDVTHVDIKAKTITVRDLKNNTEYTESYDKLVVSPGATPLLPPIKGLNNDKVFTLRTVPDTYAIKDFIDTNSPKHITIVGGGFIGLEMAENLKGLGSDITILEMKGQVFPGFDRDMAAEIHTHLENKGIDLKLNTALTEIHKDGDKLSLVLGKGKLETEMVLLAAGIRPDTDFLKDSGINLGKNGGICVDEYMRTSDNDVYAVGDATLSKNFITGAFDTLPFAGPANRQGRIAANNLSDIKSIYSGTQGTSIIKLFNKTAAVTGINEAAAKKHGFEYEKVYLTSTNHAKYYPGYTYILGKILIDKKTKKILGAQLFGEDGVDKRIDVIATAIHFGGTYEDLTDLELAYAPPYGSAKDFINMVGFIAENSFDDKINTFFWDDIKNLPRDGSVYLIDVRRKDEFNETHINDFVNMPLDELRDHINDLDKSKSVYVMCNSGQRSYIASRILAQEGFTTYNLSGGIMIYNKVMNDIKKYGE